MSDINGQIVTQRATRLLYWTVAGISIYVGLFIVLPFYAYGIPAEGAGALQQYDVKQYWPFGSNGPGRALHDVCLVLAPAAPVVLPITLIWSVLRYLSSRPRRLQSLLPAIAALLISVAYVANWRAILAWHLD